MRIQKGLVLTLTFALLTACTLPSKTEQDRPVAPIGQRVLVPTSEPAIKVLEENTITLTDTSVTDTLTTDPTKTTTVATSPLTNEQSTLLAKLPNKGAAPELTNETWFNSPPLQLADLRGNVVIVEFWTYG